MFRMILDYINEIQEQDKKGKWIGNERLEEMEHDFNKLLEQIITNRIKWMNDNSDENYMERGR